MVDLSTLSDTLGETNQNNMRKADCGCVTHATLDEVLTTGERLKCELHRKKLIKDERKFAPNMIYFT